MRPKINIEKTTVLNSFELSSKLSLYEKIKFLPNEEVSAIVATERYASKELSKLIKPNSFTPNAFIIIGTAVNVITTPKT